MIADIEWMKTERNLDQFTIILRVWDRKSTLLSIELAEKKSKWKLNIWIAMALDNGKTIWIWNEKMKVHGLCSMFIHERKSKCE